MPPVVVAIATAVSAAAANTAALFTVSSAVIEGVSSLTYAATALGVTTGALYGVGVALAPKLPDPVAMQTPLKQAMPPRQSGFGTVRVAGAYMLFCTGSTHSNIFYGVQAHLDGESDAWVAHYLNDDLMAKTVSGNYWFAPGAPGKYGGGGSNEPNLVQIDYRLGVSPETAYAISADVPAWDAAHRGDGITSTLLRCKQAKREDQAGDFPNGVPQLSSVWRAQKLFDPRDVSQTQGTRSTYKWSDNPVLCLLAYLTDASGGMGLDYARFILPAIDLWKAAADECDGLVSTSGMHATLLDDAAAGDHKIFLADTTGLTVGTVIQLATETVTVSGLGVAGEVDFTTPAALAYPHTAGELAHWSATGQQARYSCNLTYDHFATLPGDVIKTILASFDGWLGQRGDGALVVRTNTVYDAGFILSGRHIVGYQLQRFLTEEQAVNQYVVSYTDRASGYNKAEAGYVEDDADIAARGSARSQELYLQAVPSAPQAIAVGRAMLGRSTQIDRGTLTNNFAGLAVLGHRYVPIVIEDAGAVLFSGIVEVTGKPTLNLQSKQVSFPWVATGYRSNSASQALCFVLDVSKINPLSTAPILAKMKEGVANALTLIGATIGAGLDICVVACWDTATSITRRAASAGDITDIITWVDALAYASGFGFSADAAMTAAKTFFDATDAGITARRIVWVWEGAPDVGGTTDPAVMLANITAAQATLAAMPGMLVNVINTEGSDTTWAAYLDNTPDDGIPFAADATQLVALIEAAVFGSSSTPGAGYTLPALAPPSGSPLQPLAAPTITSVTPVYPNSGGGVQGARLSVVVADPGGNITWKVQWKLSADSVWTDAGSSFTATGSPLTILTGLIPATGSVDVQVAYIAGAQVSPWSSTTTATVAAALASRSLTASANLTAGQFVNIFSSGGAAKVRAADSTDDTKPADGFVLTSVLSGATVAVYGLGQQNTALSSLTPGAVYYLGVSGAATATEPSASGNYQQILGKADSATTLTFAPQATGMGLG